MEVTRRGVLGAAATVASAGWHPVAPDLGPPEGLTRYDTLVIGFGAVSHDVVGPWVAYHGGRALLVDRAEAVPALPAEVPLLDLARPGWEEGVHATVGRTLTASGAAHVVLLGLAGCPAVEQALPLVSRAVAELADAIVELRVGLGDDARWPSAGGRISGGVSRSPMRPPKDAGELAWRRKRASFELMELLFECLTSDDDGLQPRDMTE